MENILNLEAFSFPLFLAFPYVYLYMKNLHSFCLSFEWFKFIEPLGAEGQVGAAQVRDPDLNCRSALSSQ